EDARRKTVVETRNQADTVVYAAEKLMKENGGTDHGSLQDKVNELKQAMNGEDVSRMQRLMQEVQTAMQSIPQNNSAGNPVPEAEVQGTPQGDVVDGEFKDA
ncbi:MAG: Hsp70 family protein, partial [Chloroflexi bacterium]|nr:Hsp70 family protein [Chloroflexota bacterium]